MMTMKPDKLGLEVIRRLVAEIKAEENAEIQRNGRERRRLREQLQRVQAMCPHTVFWECGSGRNECATCGMELSK